MKKLFPLFLVTLISHPILSQQNKSTLTIHAGPSFPVGNYSKTAAGNEHSGYAQMGGAISLSYARRIGKSFSAIVMAGIQKNAFNTAAFEQQLSQSAFIIAAGPARLYPNWEMLSKSWINKYGLAGLSKNLLAEGTGKKLSLHVKLLAGIINSSLPSINGSSKSDTSYVVFVQNGQTATGLCFAAGTDIRYQVSKLISVVLSIGYTGSSTLSFKNVQQYITATDGGLTIPAVYQFSNSVRPPISQQKVYEARQAINTVNLSTGIAIGF